MYIEKIEIQYFRSIYRETISGLSLLNVLTGRNDVGKSNVLKAINLFFNNETDAGVPFVFSENFNFQRYNECKNSIKGKHFIQIKITFTRGQRFEKTLPAHFTVTKKWFRMDSVPSVIADDLPRALEREGKTYTDRNKSSLTAFLNRIRYIYIPAIKDSDTFRQVLALLRETIYNDSLSKDEQLGAAMDVLSKRTALAAQELNDEFEAATGVRTNLSSPKNVSELYQAISVDTEVDIEDNTINLDGRGDGIRIRYLPSILHYIAKSSSNMYIWGFEEPENSLEYILASEMAEAFEQTYCKHSQILVTSHSPAFIGLADKKTCALYRCYRDEKRTRIIALSQVQEREDLAEELGYVQIQKEIGEILARKTEEMKGMIAQKKDLLEELEKLKKPVLYTEGKTDVTILEKAWVKLYGDRERPFEIKSCNTLREEDGSAAGCIMLKNLLISIRPDSPQCIIGLFDQDQAGKEAFALNRNFEEKEDGWKRHKNGKAHALLLPTPPGKELFAKYKNLCIEFYFEKADLDKRIAGKGLELKSIVTTPKVNGVPISDVEIPDALHFQQIDKGTKNYFAETIVPTLPESSFVHFRLLFQKIETIFKAQ